MPDAGDPLGERFAELVNERSDGGVRVRIDKSLRYESRDPAGEVRLAQALKAGREDIGYLPARAWSADGPAFRALLSPFAVTTYPAAQAVATGPIARDALKALPDSVVGLALVPAQLRRVIANRPLTTAATYRALRVRVVDNVQTASDFAALGAKPVQRLDAGEVGAALADERLDAAETSPKPVLDNSYGVLAPYLTSYAVFPKFQSLVLSARAWAKLSDDQRSILRAAARDVVAAAKAIPAQEVAQLAQLCRSGVHVVTPSTAQLEALADAAAPAAAGLDAKVAAALRALPGSGPHAQATRLPQDCVTPPAPRKAAPRGAAFPEGVFVTHITEQDFRRGDVTNPTLMEDITFRTRLRAGRWSQTLDPNVPEQGPFSGTYTVDGDELTFVMLEAKSEVTAPETVRWSYFNGQLRFENVEVADFASRVLYTAHPWRKVG
jgi:TRAP-type C4-dicarboxylate transport system substrate-binding protein